MSRLIPEPARRTIERGADAVDKARRAVSPGTTVSTSHQGPTSAPAPSTHLPHSSHDASDRSCSARDGVVALLFLEGGKAFWPGRAGRTGGTMRGDTVLTSEDTATRIPIDDNGRPMAALLAGTPSLRLPAAATPGAAIEARTQTGRGCDGVAVGSGRDQPPLGGGASPCAVSGVITASEPSWSPVHRAEPAAVRQARHRAAARGCRPGPQGPALEPGAGGPGWWLVEYR
jgi:hypothetical protein